MVSSMPARRERSLVTLLEVRAGSYRWVAATVNSNSAAGYQLATDDPVMAIGGFNGTDPAPTLAQFETYVRDGDDPLLHRRRWAGRRGSVAAGQPTTPARSRPGSRATTRRRRSTASPSTT